MGSQAMSFSLYLASFSFCTENAEKSESRPHMLCNGKVGFTIAAAQSIEMEEPMAWVFARDRRPWPWVHFASFG